MERKRLGRGLDDISDIFLSTRNNKDMRNGFSSKKLRDETCKSCAHIVNRSTNASKCNIFSLNNKTYGVRYMDTISFTSGSYCEYFEPDIQENEEDGFLAKETSSDHIEINCDIEESTTVRRSVTYPDTPKSQQDILKALSKHLKENFCVKRIDLRKTDKISEPGMKKCTEENVTIFIDGGVDNGNHN